jgi:Major Facilitator Superfamily
MPTQHVREPNRWAVLALLSVAQLMVVLDATIVTVALPSAQRALHFSNENRQWVVTAYALAFGSLLLVGGKLGDLFGRKWALIAGLVGFSCASAVGGLAQSFGLLVAARATQGVFGALLAPSALSLLTVTFAGTEDWQRAFGIFGAVAGGAGAVGRRPPRAIAKLPGHKASAGRDAWPSVQPLRCGPDPERRLVRLCIADAGARGADDATTGGAPRDWRRRGLRVCGTCFNNHNATAEGKHAPFGSVNRSGVGHELGREGVLEFTETHPMSIPTQEN